MTLKEAYTKIDNTLCLNQIRGNLDFNIDEDYNEDCKCPIEMVSALETIRKHGVLIDAQVNRFYGQIDEKTVFYNPNKDFILIDFNLQRLQVALNCNFYNIVTFHFDDYKTTWWLKADTSE